MASYISLVLIAVAVSMSVTISSARVIPAEPVSVMLDAYGNPVIFLREKRSPLRQSIIPQRAMMFTGYYRPARRSDNGDQATGVFAQGNAVSGGSYLGGLPRLNRGPEPIDEPEISSAQAEAAPEQEIPNQVYNQDDQTRLQNDNNESAAPPTEEQHETPISDPEPLPYDIEAPAQTPDAPDHSVSSSHKPASPAIKKGKKTPVYQENDDDDDDDEAEDDTPYFPVSPVKGNKRRQGARIPNLNNFFPMMFSFPGFSTRAGSSGSPPGVVTAIANSYSTGKGGVASSVATAYGGSPTGKKGRRAPAVNEE